MKKRLFATGLSLLLVLAMVPTAFAEGRLYIIDGQDPVQYENLSTAAAAGTSVQLTDSETVSEQIMVSNELTIDLNGFTLTKGSGAEAVFFVEEGGALTITDSVGNGAIVGSSGSTAAVTVYGGTLTLAGGTIRGNTSTAEGGGIYVENGTVTMEGGAVTGNTAAEGGGIYATGDSTITINGGEISDNTATNFDMINGTSPRGGGGIAIVGGYKNGSSYNISLNVNGGVIQKNEAAGAGGGIGIRRGDWRCTPVFQMTGGSVINNIAQSHEGGGIRIEGKGTIQPGGQDIRITGNICNSTSDLGGGGLFVVNSGYTAIYNAVITDNTAGGLGGGVAGCIHGQISNISTTGAAIYGNGAQGMNFTDDGKADEQNTVQGALGSLFTVNDAMDFFSAGERSSIVGDWMPGGGSHRWTGSDGGTPIAIPAGTAYESLNYLVLTAHPTKADLDGLGKLTGGVTYIEGNYARNHGGGVAVNGVLKFGGQESQYNVVAEAYVDVSKTVERFDETAAPLDGYTFQLVDQRGTVLADAVTDGEGKARLYIPADQFTPGEQTYTYNLILQEQNGSVAGTVYDDTKYAITVTVTKEREETISFGEVDAPVYTITIHHYTADVRITKPDGTPLETGEVPSFTNEIIDVDTSYTISGSKAVNTGAPSTAFTFELLDEKGDVLQVKKLTGGGSFTFEPIAYDKAGTYEYTVREVSGNEDNWTYDDTRYTVTVIVTEGEHGVLMANAEITVEGETEPTEEIVFYNNYDKPDSSTTSYAISGTKEVNTGAPDTQFTFELLDKDGNQLQTETISGGGSFTFEPITYDKAGTYEYTVLEVSGNKDNWTYDDTRYTVTVTVTEGENGTLTADVEITVEGKTEPTEEIVFYNNYDKPDSGSTSVSVRVKKEWVLDDGRTMPDSVTVELLRNGKPVRQAILSEDNDWSYRWTGLSGNYTWTVAEIDVPAGFISTVERSGSRSFTIVNDDIPEEEFVSTQVSVEKRWVLDDGGTIPDSVTVTLLRDGEPYDTVTLNAAGGWSHTWAELETGHTWTVEEQNVPEGFTSSVTQYGKAFTIVNDDIPEEEVVSTQVSVEKRWVLDNGGTVPDSVTVALLRDGEPYDTVTLNAAGGWSHTWAELETGHTWTVEEKDVPEGFTASVTQEGMHFVLTNDDILEQHEEPEEPDQPTLPQTGQPWRAVGLLAAAGAILLALGAAGWKRHDDKRGT